MRPEHPLVVALVEATCRQLRIEPSEFWAAVDGKRGHLAQVLALALMHSMVDVYARLQLGVDPERFRAWLERREAPPPIVLQGLLTAFAPRVKAEDFLTEGLPSTPENSTIRTMQTDEVSEARVGRPLKHTDHPFVTALVEHGVTLAEEAKAVKRTPTALRNYLYPQGHANARPVPRQLAKLWKTKYGVPLSAWQNIKG